MSVPFHINQEFRRQPLAQAIAAEHTSMKKCPTCEKTFDDNMRFCQADGTPLVSVEEEIDPYKTMVARPEDLAAAIPPVTAPPPAQVEEPVLELPSQAEPDPNKTQFVSEEELRAEMAAVDAPVIEMPPPVPTAPEPPVFNAPSPAPPSFGETPPPRSPFDPEPPKAAEPEVPASPFASDLTGDPFAHTTPPIPSPFGGMKPGSMQPDEVLTPKAAEPAPGPPPFAEPSAPQQAYNPFEHSAAQPQAMAQAEWTPPAAPQSNWQEQEIGQNTPFQPPPAGTETPSKTLAVVALVLGIISILPCCGFLGGIPAVIIGLIARSRAKNDPANYTGGGLALGGIITGIIGTILSIVLTILQLMMYGAQGILGNF